MHRILAINPGSTSTKITIYEDEQLQYKNSIKHPAEELQKFPHVYDQFSYRKQTILDAIADSPYTLDQMDAIVGRGGMLKPIEGGTYTVNNAMIEYMKQAPRGEHASNLGCVIAKDLAAQINVPAYIVDPVAVDEMDDIARYTGMPQIKRQSLFHALNQKAVALKASDDLGIPYQKARLIVAHLGGGISVGVHKNGRVIDVNNALDGDGPMSPERSGSVPLGPLYKMAFSGDYTLAEIKRMNYGNGGLLAYLGTNDGFTISKRIEAGDEEAKFLVEVMCYQIAKEIGSCATVLEGQIDAIVLTGGLAKDPFIVEEISKRVRFLGTILLFPGEDEMEALTYGALRVLRGLELPKTYL
ncbi:butyrate kinase [Candidatus Xianfuyuplasma coldseepsis]|uniref:Probable butyrate kinase n=1 Tax=Candidatus Xianfuyuplasma coldseepsis TaxID=2782163 RepID=A0A7L7KQH4_9MOLU|nr:butyrate kinase [Xianfuyuplasma coldseepsis]QMS84194.1 butyrate kinase [Xianfuyuplasma coldseepsis]